VICCCMFLAYSSRLTAKQVTYDEEDVLTFAVAGFSLHTVVKITYNHAALGPVSVQVGWTYKFVLKNVEMQILVLGLEAYVTARK
jgi:hypothetical protein